MPGLLAGAATITVIVLTIRILSIMNPADHNQDPYPTVFADDALLALELRVASRADQLSLEFGGGRDKDLEYWLQAEREVLADTCLCEFK